MNEDTTHFGYREVKTSEKAGLVGQVFRQVAGQYDLMNDLMSLHPPRHETYGSGTCESPIRAQSA
jgi:ubiquinone/menaquinone biosynthesis C-methylase UbiE